MKEIKKLYRDFGVSVINDWASDDCETLMLSSALKSFDWVSQFGREEIESKVPNKSYFRFLGNVSRKKFSSKGINHDLWIGDRKNLETSLQSLKNIRKFPISPEILNKTLYTASMAFSCVSGAYGDSRRMPGTYFEYLIRYVFSCFFDIEAKTSLPILSMDEGIEESLKVDLTYDLGIGKPKFLVPVKTSTRERIIQVWAHQRIVDGVFGMGRYRGLPVFLGETKTDKKKGEVVEICTPFQLKLQNWYVARMWQVVYLDLPAKYADLRGEEDDFTICTLGELLGESGRLRKVIERLGE